MRTILTIITAMSLSTNSLAEIIKPKTIKEFNKVTVKIMGKNSGGTGVILKSTETASYILTNRHVCKIGENGFLKIITSDRNEYTVDEYNFSPRHDVCVAKINHNLKIGTKVAKSRANFGDKIIVSGHPFLYPNLVFSGHMSNDMRVSLMTDIVKCDEKEKEENFLCDWFGGLPLVSVLDSQVASFSIAGGSSGSAVYNADGEIVALVFAGTGDGMSPAILVPYEYVRDFLREGYKKSKWVKVSNSYIFSRDSKPKSNERVIDFEAIVIKDFKYLDSMTLKFPSIFSEINDTLIFKYNCFKKKGESCLED